MELNLQTTQTTTHTAGLHINFYKPQTIFYSTDEQCSTGELRYKFDNDWLNSSLVTDYDLICDNDGDVKNAKSMHMFGFVLAGMIQVFSDKYGRKLGMITFLLITAFLFLLNGMLQSQSYTTFGILQMLMVTFANGACLTFTVYGIEILGPRKKVYSKFTIDERLS